NGSHKRGTPEYVHRCRLPIVASWEVAVIRSHDGIGYPYRLIGPTPLADTGAASIRQNDAVDVFERLHLAIAFDGGAHLFRSGRDQKGHGCLDAVRLRLLCHICRAAHILIGGIGATAD